MLVKFHPEPSGSAGRAVVGLLALAVLSSSAMAQSDADPPSVQLTFGLKLWPTAWESWVTSPKGTGVALGTSRFQTVQAVGSSSGLSPIPFAVVRRGAWFGSVSAMGRTRYTLRDTATPGGFDVKASRSELDFSGGYDLLPGLTVTLGLKRLTQTYGSDEFRWRGAILGLTGSAPIGGGLALYGNTGLGRMKAQFPAAQQDVLGHRNFNADYRLGEFGLAYATPWSGRFPRSVLVTAGYRAQFVKTRNYALAVTDGAGISSFNAYSDLKDATQGFVFGLNGSF